MGDQRPADIVLESLRGGLNTTDPANALAIDECTEANNVEFYLSMLGERRKGCTGIDLTGSGLEAEATIVFLCRHFPTADVQDTELWAVGATEGVSASVARLVGGVWAPVPIANPGDAINTNATYIYNIQAQSLDGKLFLAYKSAVDRLHVWDGTRIRVTGLRQPDPPTAANEGVDTYTGVRYFRVRYIVKNVGGDLLLRSEPSESLAFTPSGAGAGATITKPATINENETHWEVEASLDDATFYRIATIAVATTTYDDETALATGYSFGELSETIGDYNLIPSVEQLTVDDDRLIVGGAFEEVTQASYVAWTPVRKDPGVGNSERIPFDRDNTVILDSYEGGRVTGLSQAISGSWYAFKWAHLYKFVRTGDADKAYQNITLSKVRGAIRGSVASGMDEYGRPCIYFLDPRIGPSRIAVGGLQEIRGLLRTWKTVNTTTYRVGARTVYYPDKGQVYFWVPTYSSDFPTLRLVLQVSEVRETAGGVRRGWVTATGLSAQAVSATIMSEFVEDDDSGVLSFAFRPYIGLPSPYLIQRCDVTSKDAETDYHAHIRTRPIFLTGLLNKFGAMRAALLASPSDTARLLVKFIRDFGKETNEVMTDLAPEDVEEYVIKDFDNLVMSEALALQVEFSDPEPEDRLNARSTSVFASSSTPVPVVTPITPPIVTPPPVAPPPPIIIPPPPPPPPIVLPPPPPPPIVVPPVVPPITPPIIPPPPPPPPPPIVTPPPDPPVGWYVSTTGDDVLGTGTIANPFRTVVKGVSMAVPGDGVWIRGGTYTGSNATINSQTHTVNSGTGSGLDYTNPITISGYPGETAILQPPSGVGGISLGTPVSYLIIQDLTVDLSNSAFPATGEAVYLFTCHHIRLQRLDIKNGAGFGVHSGDSTPFIEIIDCHVHNFGYPGSVAGDCHGLYVTGSDALYEGNHVHDNDGYGFHIYNNSGSHADPSRVRCVRNRVHDNGIHASGEHGIVIAWGDDNEVSNNLVYNNPGGIQVYTGSTNAKVYNNSIYNNTPYAGITLQFYSAPAPIVRNNIVYLNGTPIDDIGGTAVIDHNQSTNPSFTSPGTGVFTLQEGSTAIDAGVTIAAVPDDYIGTVRPQRLAYDIGAYEKV